METSYSDIIEKNLQEYSTFDESVITTIKNDLDVICSKYKTAKAPLKAVVASAIAKLVHPDWDTRKHQLQIGGKKSLRSIDKAYISSYLFKKGLYSTSTEYALTRSFELSEPYTKTYTGKICGGGPEKESFLNIVHEINENYSENLCSMIIRFILNFLTKNYEVNSVLSKKVLPNHTISIVTLSNIIIELTNAGIGMSVIPVIIVHVTCNFMQQYIWKNCLISPLKEHTAADSSSDCVADIEGYSEDKLFLAIEVKNHIKIDDTIINIFDKKTSPFNMNFRYIVTTDIIHTYHVKEDIVICDISSFVCQYIHQLRFYNLNIVSEFISKIRQSILDYKNLDIEYKQKLESIFTKYSV
jgi:hypothetical protein